MKDNQLVRSVRACASPARIPEATPLFGGGDMVMHPSEGVCTVTGIRSMRLGSPEMRSYYILKPTTEKSSSTVYLPVARGNTVLRRLLTRADVLSLIRRSKALDSVWIADSKQRKEAFRRILAEGDCARIIRMISEIRRENAQRILEGKKPCAADEAVRQEAERILHQEFSCVLHLSLKETAAFIAHEIEGGSS